MNQKQETLKEALSLIDTQRELIKSYENRIEILSKHIKVNKELIKLTEENRDKYKNESRRFRYGLLFYVVLCLILIGIITAQ
ncbi:hypothetical protein ACJRPK_13945 [Aquimarina sp. 2-A2]|uniref:hypothetical protein n=1 Tax=Aquimarina sp. 2-A2 TaxID=3382644 RepID=UPI00387F33FA